jgi:integrase
MPRLLNCLSRKRIREIERDKPVGMFADGDALYLQVTPRGSVSWVLFYRYRGRRRKMGLGPLRLVDVKVARQKRDEARLLLLDGIDPLASRVTRRAKQTSALTFFEAARRYIEETAAKRKEGKSAEAWSMTLLGRSPEGERTKFNYCARLHGVSVGEIDSAMVIDVLKPIWSKKPQTASRLRGRIEKVLDYAVVHGLAGEVDRNRLNPAKWAGNLEHVFPHQGEVAKVAHHPALPYAELPDFVTELRRLPGVAARALEFAILTAARNGEVRGATFDEFDFDAKVWTVPAGRMKASREHRVPLSDRAVEIVAESAKDVRGVGFVFPGQRPLKPLSDMAARSVLDRMGRDGVTTHGFRSTFRTWAGERTSFQRETIEAALAHSVGDRVEAAYQRGDLFEKRVRLMQAWSDFCEGEASANVIAIAR